MTFRLDQIVHSWSELARQLGDGGVSRTLRSAARTRFQTAARIRGGRTFLSGITRTERVRTVDRGQHLAERDLGRAGEPGDILPTHRGC